MSIHIKTALAKAREANKILAQIDKLKSHPYSKKVGFRQLINTKTDEVFRLNQTIALNMRLAAKEEE